MAYTCVPRGRNVKVAEQVFYSFFLLYKTASFSCFCFFFLWQRCTFIFLCAVRVAVVVVVVVSIVWSSFATTNRKIQMEQHRLTSNGGGKWQPQK